MDTCPLAIDFAELIETSPLDVAEPAPLVIDTAPPDDDPVEPPPTMDMAPPVFDDDDD